MKEPRRQEHPEILVETAGSGIFDTAFGIIEKKYGPDVGRSTGHISVVAANMGLHDFISTDCNKAHFLCLYNWWANGKPIYRMTEELCLALAHTDPPMKTFDLDPRACVPLNGMYIALPPVFYIGSTVDDEQYAIEGLYITEDLVRPEHGEKAEPGVLFLGVGEDLAKGKWLHRNFSEGPCRDDSLVFFAVCGGKDMKHVLSGTSYGEDREILGAPELAKLGVNLLWMLQNVPSSVSSRSFSEVVIKARKERTRRREIERARRKGRTHRGYILLDLSSRQRASTKGSSPGTRTVKAHVVRGHIHHYWVTDPKDAKAAEEKTEHGKRRYLVPKWVLPYRKGKKAL